VKSAKCYFGQILLKSERARHLEAIQRAVTELGIQRAFDADSGMLPF
jgi:hypothetical protein